MSHGYTARATWALEVPPGEILVPADKGLDFPVCIRVSMAAIDPTEEPTIEEGETVPRIPRSTLKIVRMPPIVDDSDEEDDDDELTPEQLRELKALIAKASDDSEDDDDDESESDDEPEAGPSSSKSKRSKDAGVKKLTAALKDAADDSDEEMADESDEEGAKPNGIKKNKGKAKASVENDEDSESDLADSDLEDDEQEIAVICTLDTERNYQQPLDIIVQGDENVGFIVNGTHSVFLTGNLVTHYEEGSDDEDYSDEEDYDLEPDSDELMDDDSEDESDILDGQRITEIRSDEEEEAPKLVSSASQKKGSKKRRAEDETETLDELIKAQEKQDKKQLKKMKTNKGEAVSTKDAKVEAQKETKADKAEKKVQFAKNLEQGPTGSEAKKPSEKKTGSNITVVKGVKIDDRKICEGRKAKSGDRVGVRYIGKLENGKVFDANKKGPPFTFKLGKGDVIKGWDIGVTGMAVGGERRLIIPPNMAYGNKALPDIPKNSTLIFDVKLLEIK